MNTIKLFYKKGPKLLTFIISLALLVNLTSAGYLIYNLFLYQGISLLSIIRIILIVVFLITNILLFLLSINATLKRKYIKVVIIILVTLGMAFGTYYVTTNFVNKIYNSISKISEKESTYATDLVVKTDSTYKNYKDLVNVKIGVINTDLETDQNANIDKMLTSLKLEESNEIKEYEDYVSLIKALLEKDIEAAILPGGFKNIYSSTEGLTTIDTDLTTIHSETFKVQATVNKKTSIKKPFTLLIMGIDGTGENINQANSINGDALMMITFNPKTLNTTMLSIPRDSYVPITCLANNKQNKITHAGVGGEKCMMDTIENFTGINIDYYVKINFSGVVNLVDDLGGVDVNVPIKFCEQDSKRRKGKYEICLKPGEQHLTGEEALALSRHRKTIDDFRRGYNQQLVVSAMIDKTKKIRKFSTLTNMMDTVSNSMKTNMTTKEITSLMDLVQKSSGNEKFTSERLYLSGEGRMIYESSFGKSLYNYVLYEESLSDSVNAMKVNLELKKATIIKKFSFDYEKPYVAAEIGRGNYSKLTSSGSVMPSLVGKTKDYVISWAKQNHLTLKVTEVTTSKQTEDNKVITQTIKAGNDFSGYTSLTVTVGKYTAPITTPPTEVTETTEETTTEPTTLT